VNVNFTEKSHTHARAKIATFKTEGTLRPSTAAWLTGISLPNPGYGYHEHHWFFTSLVYIPGHRFASNYADTPSCHQQKKINNLVRNSRRASWQPKSNSCMTTRRAWFGMAAAGHDHEISRGHVRHDHEIYHGHMRHDRGLPLSQSWVRQKTGQRGRE